MIKAQGFALYGPLAASTRYRLAQFVPGLRAFGIDLQLVHLLDDNYLGRRFNGQMISYSGLVHSGFCRWRDLWRLRRFDLAMVHCELFPLMPGWMERAVLNKPYLYDFDDAFYLKYRSGSLRQLKLLLANKFDAVVGGAAAVSAGNEVLGEYARRFNTRTSILPTVVDVRRYVPNARRKSGSFTVGWIGSPSTTPYLVDLVEPLRTLAREAPVKLVVVGGRAPVIPGVEVVALPWSEDTEVSLINSFDVGVMPLPDNDWSRGKCAFKVIQYMACGVPVVASAVGTNTVVVTPECGFLTTSKQDWIDALRSVRDTPQRARQMGEAGRHRVVDQYSLDVVLPRLASILHTVAGR